MIFKHCFGRFVAATAAYWRKAGVIWCGSSRGGGLPLVQEWTGLLLSLTLVAVQKFMWAELHWLTLICPQTGKYFPLLDWPSTTQSIHGPLLTCKSNLVIFLRTYIIAQVKVKYGWSGQMYFHQPKVSENSACLQSNIQPFSFNFMSAITAWTE